MAGYGEGELTLTPEKQSPIETDMDLAMGGVGVRGVVLTPCESEGPEVAVTSNAFVVRTTSDRVPGMASAEADVTRLRLGLEGSWTLPLGDGHLVPSLEVGVRQDGGDAETGFGTEIGAGLAWSDPSSGVTADVRARGLLTHDEGSFRERGFAGSLAWDPDPNSERGLKLTLRQTVGASAEGGMNALLSRPTLEGLAANDEGDELGRRRLEATLGYGLPLFGDRFIGTPEIGLSLSDADREMRLGWRLALARRKPVDLNLGVEATRREAVNDDREPEHGMGLRLTARW